MCAAVFVFRGNAQSLFFLAGFCLFVLWLGLNALWLPALPERMGDWSYGTYLYGFPVQQLLVFFGVPVLGLGMFVLSSTVLTLMLAAASWYLVEKPALRWK